MKHIVRFLMLFLICGPARADDVVAPADEFYTFGAAICGYGQYRINGICVAYGADNTDSVCGGPAVTGGACLSAFIDSSAEIFEWYPFNSGYGDFGVSVTELSDVEKACGSVGVIGGACLNAFIESSNEVEDWYPFWGGFGDLGASSDFFETTLENVCMGGAMDGYYVAPIGSDVFVPLQNGECAAGYDSYIISNDCQYIDMSSKDSTDIHSPKHNDNYMCGVLCDTGKMYTGTGACSQRCKINGQDQRLYVGGDGLYSAPLWVDKLTTPGMSFQFSNGARCYMNLLQRRNGDVAVRYKNQTYYSSY